MPSLDPLSSLHPDVDYFPPPIFEPLAPHFIHSATRQTLTTTIMPPKDTPIHPSPGSVMSPEQKVAMEQAKAERAVAEAAAAKDRKERAVAEAAANKDRKERAVAEAEAAKDRKAIANALARLADRFEEMGTPVDQHTGQIRDLQGGREKHAAQIRDLKADNRDLRGQLTQQGKELDQVKQLVAMSVTGQRQQQREGGEEAEEDDGVESETFHEAFEEEEEEAEESPVAAKEAEVDASSEEESARSSDDDSDIGEDEVEDDGAPSGVERVESAVKKAFGYITGQGDRIGHLQNDMTGLKAAVADTQNRERMNNLEIETIKVKLSSAGL